MNGDFAWRGLADAWWRQRSDPVVRAALIKPLAKYWKKRIDARLEANRVSGCQPARLRDIAAELGIHEANLFRKREGKTSWDALDVLTVARSLGLSVSEFYPSFDFLLIEATCQLCRDEVSRDDASIYVAYRLLVPRATSRTLNGESLAQVQCQFSSHSLESLEELILRVATCVGARLVAAEERR